jgi:hypothetical protein
LSALALISKYNALREEDDKLERLRLSLMEAEAYCDDRKHKLYASVVPMKKVAYGNREKQDDEDD